jgi:HAD superfamily hydrolase (TIGR01458 family)
VAAPEALLIDIDGVLVVSWEALGGAREAFSALREAHIPLRLLTNTTSRTPDDITTALQDSGFDVTPDEILTVTTATASYLATHHAGSRCLVLNSGDITSAFHDVSVVAPETSPEAVDVVVLGGAGPEFTYDALNHALACLLGGAALVAMHRNLVWRTSTGMQLDTGAFVVGLERAAGVEAVIIGKPAPAMFDAALESLGVDRASAAMIGDDLDTDVRAAQALGITGVQVRTGKFRASQLDDGDPPDVLLDSFADVPAWMGLGR